MAVTYELPGGSYLTFGNAYSYDPNDFYHASVSNADTLRGYIARKGVESGATSVVTLNNGNRIRFYNAANGNASVTFYLQDSSGQQVQLLSVTVTSSRNVIFCVSDDGVGYVPEGEMFLPVQYANGNLIGNTVSFPATVRVANAFDRRITLAEFFGDTPIKSPYTFDTSTTGGGDGEYDDTSDIISPPEGFPDFSLPSGGFLRVWQPTSAQLAQISTWLWSSSFVDNVIRLNSNPIESIFALIALPIDPLEAGTTTFHVGNVSADFEANYLKTLFTEMDCGTLHISKYWGSALDYSPYTQVQIVLPYVGAIPLDVDEVMDKDVSVRYRIQLSSGDFICLVIVDGNVLYSKTGNCAMSFPITQGDYQNITRNALNLAVSAATLVATKGMSAAVSASTALQSAINTTTAKPDISHTGNLSSASGWLGVQYPYLIIKRTRQSLPENYGTYEGLPSNITSILGDLSGYTVVESVHIDDIPLASDNEKEEIERLLKEGVIL